MLFHSNANLLKCQHMCGYHWLVVFSETYILAANLVEFNYLSGRHTSLLTEYGWIQAAVPPRWGSTLLGIWMFCGVVLVVFCTCYYKKIMPARSSEGQNTEMKSHLSNSSGFSHSYHEMHSEFKTPQLCRDCKQLMFETTEKLSRDYSILV